MGSVSLKIGDGTARFRWATLYSSAVNILMLFSVLTTNLFALYAFTSGSCPNNNNKDILRHSHKNISLITEQVSIILREIESSQKKLPQMEKDILGYNTIDLSRPNTPNELKIFLHHHALPLGKDSRTGITEMMASVGHSCAKSADMLSQCGPCPDDWSLAQKLILRGCEPLPRRRCFAKTVPKVGLTSFPYSLWNCPDDWSLAQKLILRGCEPLPRRRCFAKTVPKVGLTSFPYSLWKNVSAKSVTWSGLGYKNFECLTSKKLTGECVGCFDLASAVEKQRFLKARSKNDFVVDDVLILGGGGIRVGFDIGGESGTFAARMAERNVTVITNTLNLDAPYSEFVAARGLFPLYLSLDHRFPFYDNAFDLVHAANGLDIGGKLEKFEFLMFDIDWILRPGGLFWLDEKDEAEEKEEEEEDRFMNFFFQICNDYYAI